MIALHRNFTPGVKQPFTLFKALLAIKHSVSKIKYRKKLG